MENTKTVGQVWAEKFSPDFYHAISNMSFTELMLLFSGCKIPQWAFTIEEFYKRFVSGDEDLKQMLFLTFVHSHKTWLVPSNWFKMSFNEREAFKALQWDIHKPQPRIVVLTPTEWACTQGFHTVYHFLEEGKKLWEEYKEEGLDSLFYYSEI